MNAAARRMSRTLLFVALCLAPLVTRAQDDDEPPPAAGPLALPYAAAPGAATPLTFYGATGAPLAVWTSLPGATAADLAQDGKKLRCTLTVPATAPVGIAAMRLLTTTGVAPPQLFMIDDLPTVSKHGKIASPATAQPIEVPCAVDGTAERLSADYYKLALKRGQRLSVEVVANRLGSQLDPVLRLLDATGVREVAYSEDAPGAGADARFTLTAPADADYLLELRDDAYNGGGDYRYHLRVGDFPLAVGAFPPSFKRGATTRVAVEGPAVEHVAPQTVTFPADAARTSLAFKFPGGRSSGFVSLFTTDLDELAVPKKQLTGSDPFKVTPPVALAGRFTKPGSRDFYAVDAKKGDKLTFRIQTRMIGSPCDPMLRVLKPDGTVLTQLKPTSVVVADEKKGPPPPPASDDETLDATIPEDGTYKFSIEDLTRSGGPGLVYHLVVEPTRPGFALLIDSDKADADRSVAKLKVKVTRRNYAGPIALRIEGLPGAALTTPTIPDAKTDADLDLKLPPDLKPGLYPIRLLGTAQIDTTDVTATASTRTALRRQFPRMLPRPAELEGLIFLTVR